MEEHSRRVFENVVLRQLLRLTGMRYRKLRLLNDELYDLYCSSNICRVSNEEE